MTKNTRLRFSVEDDLYILQQVIKYNPFDEGCKWKVIQRDVVAKTGKEFSVRAIREHVDLLVKLYLKEDKANLKKSGSEQQYEEKCQMLQTISCMKNEFIIVDVRSTAMDCSDQNETEMRENSQYLDSEEATETVIQYEIKQNEEPEQKYHKWNLEKSDEKYNQTRITSPSPSAASTDQSAATRPRKRKHHTSQKKDPLQINKREDDTKEKFFELEERKLKLEERRLKLEEQRFELEKKERTLRLEMEIKERTAALKEKEAQQELLKFFMDNFNKEKKV